jgi:tRNA G18 (ribose-2'-O)-methylase SpoU
VSSAVREAGGVPDLPRASPDVTMGPLVPVDDPADPRLDLYRHLKDPAARSRLDARASVFVIEGRLAVDRLLASNYPIRSLLVDDHQAAAAGDLVEATRSRGAPVFVGSRAVVAGTVGFDLHRGVVAVADRPPLTDAGDLLADVAGRPDQEGAPPRVAVLEGLNDHENIGSLFRNAAAFGVAGLLLDPTCADPLYRRSVRVSVGHVLHLPFARMAPWPAGLGQVKSAGFLLAALAPCPAVAGAVPVIGLDQLHRRVSGPGGPRGVALLLGAEGPGLSDGALALSDVVVTIPMADGVDSLNVATAAAVAFHALSGP